MKPTLAMLPSKAFLCFKTTEMYSIAIPEPDVKAETLATPLTIRRLYRESPLQSAGISWLCPHYHDLHLHSHISSSSFSSSSFFSSICAKCPLPSLFVS